MQTHRIVNEFIELVKISSPSKNERAMADVLKKKLVDLGFEVYEDNTGEKIGGTAGNIIAKLKGTIGRPLILSSHMDRVSGGDGICPIITDDKIVSDGNTILAADDISGVAAILEGIRQLKESGKPHCDIEVVFTVSEEFLLLGGRNIEFEKLKGKYAYCFDSPGHIGRIINGAPYMVRFIVDVYGKRAHAGNNPELGVNALKAAAKILATIEEGRLDFETTSNFGVITAGEVTNIVCEKAQFIGEARSRSKEKLMAYSDYVAKHCEKTLENEEAYCVVKFDPTFDGFTVSKDDELITSLTSVLKDMGIEPLIEEGGGGMDANFFNKNGIKSIGVATGYFKNHSPEEELYIKDLIESGNMIFNLIMKYSSYND